MDDTTVRICEIIVSAITAIATVVAVIVALWQTKYSNKKKLKIKATETVNFYLHMLDTNKKQFSPRLFSFTVANVGNRKIRIIEYGIYLNKSLQIKTTDIYKDSGFDLDIEESRRMDLEMKGIIDVLRQQAAYIKNQNLKLKVYVKDSSGRIYAGKLPRSKKDYLSMSDEDLMIPID